MLIKFFKPNITRAFLLAMLCTQSISYADTSALPDGLWWRDGYGKVLKIENAQGVEYQFTRTSCLKTAKLDSTLIDSMAARIDSVDSNTLYLNPSVGIGFQERYRRIDALPSYCDDSELITSSTPLNSFESFWQSVSDYYAFLGQRNIDWNQQYSTHINLVDNNMTDDALFDVFQDMLSDFNDRHVQISNLNRSYTPSKSRGATRIIEESFKSQTDYDDLTSYSKSVREKYKAVRNEYLDQNSIHVIDGALPARITWATMENGQIGYLHIANMALLTTQYYGYDEASNLEMIRSLMPNIMADFQDTQSVIIDVRDNSGGFDSVSFTIASYFTSQTRKVVSKVARSYAGETEPVDFYLEPATESPYLKPVVIISGEETGSAAEVFLITMKALPQVTVIGEQSRGTFSDILMRTLPNNWSLWLSNEVYRDSNGVGHEVTGVTPDVFVPTFTMAGLDFRVNFALEKALHIIHHSTTATHFSNHTQYIGHQMARFFMW